MNTIHFEKDYRALFESGCNDPALVEYGVFKRAGDEFKSWWDAPKSAMPEFDEVKALQACVGFDGLTINQFLIFENEDNRDIYGKWYCSKLGGDSKWYDDWDGRSTDQYLHPDGSWECHAHYFDTLDAVYSALSTQSLHKGE